MIFFPKKRLSKLIHSFVSKREQRIVLEQLWQACKYRFYEDNIASRKDLLIEIIQDLADEELKATSEYFDSLVKQEKQRGTNSE